MDKRLLTLKFPECGVTTLYLNGKTYTREEFHKAQHKGKVFKKNIGVNVSPVSSKYTLPRMKQATNEVSEDLPLFMW